MSFSWPILVLVLAERVDERKKRGGIGRPRGWGDVGASGAEPVNLEGAGFFWLVHEEQNLGDIRGVDGAGTTAGHRIAPHAEELATQRFIAGTPQFDLQGAALTRVECDRPIDTIFRAIGSGVVNAAIQGAAGGGAGQIYSRSDDFLVLRIFLLLWYM